MGQVRSLGRSSGWGLALFIASAHDPSLALVLSILLAGTTAFVSPMLRLRPSPAHSPALAPEFRPSSSHGFGVRV